MRDPPFTYNANVRASSCKCKLKYEAREYNEDDNVSPERCNGIGVALNCIANTVCKGNNAALSSDISRMEFQNSRKGEGEKNSQPHKSHPNPNP